MQWQPREQRKAFRRGFTENVPRCAHDSLLRHQVRVGQCQETMDPRGRHAFCCKAAAGARTAEHDECVHSLYHTWKDWGLPVSYPTKVSGLSEHDPLWEVTPDLALEGEVGSGLAGAGQVFFDLFLHVPDFAASAPNRRLLQGGNADAVFWAYWYHKVRTEYGGGPSQDSPKELVPIGLTPNCRKMKATLQLLSQVAHVALLRRREPQGVIRKLNNPMLLYMVSCLDAAVARANYALLQRAGSPICPLSNIGREAADDLHQLHHGHRVHEMHPHDAARLVRARRDLGDRDG